MSSVDNSRYACQANIAEKRLIISSLASSATTSFPLSFPFDVQSH